MVGNQLSVEVRAAALCLPVSTDAFFFNSVYTQSCKIQPRNDHLINYEMLLTQAETTTWLI